MLLFRAFLVSLASASIDMRWAPPGRRATTQASIDLPRDGRPSTAAERTCPTLRPVPSAPIVEERNMASRPTRHSHRSLPPHREQTGETVVALATDASRGFLPIIGVVNSTVHNL